MPVTAEATAVPGCATPSTGAASNKADANTAALLRRARRGERAAAVVRMYFLFSTRANIRHGMLKNGVASRRFDEVPESLVNGTG
jgi:hypothetical protein